MPEPMSPRKPRVLIVNCFSDRHRGARGNPHFVPQSIAVYALAGVLNEAACELQTHCEFAQGPLEDLRRLAWADVLVLTGLNPALDRMKQLCAYARTLQPAVWVLMGGPLARVLPKLCARYFDEVVGGDVEALAELMAERYGPALRREPATLRHDLAPAGHLVAYAETSRNCNFACRFCAMTAERRPHQLRPLEELRQLLDGLPRKRCLMFLDQNFFGGARGAFLDKLALLREFHQRGQLRGWAALVTSEFFAQPELLALARESGCIGFFSGIESLDPALLRRFGKKQNLAEPQLARMARCLQAGMTFHYGLIHDPLERRAQELEAELDELLHSPVTLPSFISLAIPLLGTPLFAQRLQQRELLPGLRLRDMDGRSLMTQALDDDATLHALVRRMERGFAPRAALLAHGLRLWRSYRQHMPRTALASALSPNLAHAFPGFGTAGREAPRSHDARTEVLGSLYQPAIALPERWRGHFAATQVTDAEGALAPELRADLEGAGAPGRPIRLLPPVPAPVPPLPPPRHPRPPVWEVGTA
jgi:hypothetical protein